MGGVREVKLAGGRNDIGGGRFAAHVFTWLARTPETRRGGMRFPTRTLTRTCLPRLARMREREEREREER
jgi:hypothetical protein